NLHAEPILKSLSDVERNLEQRRQTAEQIQKSLSHPIQSGIEFMPDREVNWVYDIRVPGLDAAAIVKELNEQGLDARQAFKPMSEQDEYRGHYRHLNAYVRSRDTFYVPLDPQRTHISTAAIQRAVRNQQPKPNTRTMWD